MTDETNGIESAIEKAVRLAGGQKALADKIGVSKAFVHQMVHCIRPVPHELRPKISRAVNGRVSQKALGEPRVQENDSQEQAV